MILGFSFRNMISFEDLLSVQQNSNKIFLIDYD